MNNDLDLYISVTKRCEIDYGFDTAMDSRLKAGNKETKNKQTITFVVGHLAMAETFAVGSSTGFIFSKMRG